MNEAAKPKSFFTDSQRRLVKAILNRLVPTNGDLPGAGDLGVVDFVDRAVASSSELSRLFHEGLAAIDNVSTGSFGGDFDGLGAERQDRVLRRVESEQPSFFDALVAECYKGYYSRPDVRERIGLGARPPQPLGYQMDPFDPSGLDNVRGRGRIYRDTG